MAALDFYGRIGIRAASDNNRPFALDPVIYSRIVLYPASFITFSYILVVHVPGENPEGGALHVSQENLILVC